MSTQAATFDLHKAFDQAREGDETALGQLVERYKNLVFSVALGVLGDVEAARDATQGVFLAAWQRLRGLRSASSIPPWLRETARRQALHHLRGKLRERARWEQDPLAPSAAPNADVQLIEREDAPALELALDQLPPEQREVLLLYYSEEQSVAQVASLLDLSEAAVKKRLQRGRALLREEHAQVLSTKTARVAPSAALVAAILASLRGTAQAAPRPTATVAINATAAAALIVIVSVGGAILARSASSASVARATASTAASNAPPSAPGPSSLGAKPTPSAPPSAGTAVGSASKGVAPASNEATASPPDCDDKEGIITRRALAIARGAPPPPWPSPPSEIAQRLERAYVDWRTPMTDRTGDAAVDEATSKERSARWHEAVAWLIPRCSAARDAVRPEMTPRRGEADPDLERLWLAEVAKQPNNARVLYNAARFIVGSSPEQAYRLLERAAELEPGDALYSFALAEVDRSRAANIKGDEKRDAEQNAIGFYEQALDRARSPSERAQVLGRFAGAAIAAGEYGIVDQRAHEELELVPSLRPYQVANALHEGHILLGKLALRRDDQAEAASELLTAANVEGSPTLNSFGPDTQLAQALLARGQRDVVLRYLERVARFWKEKCLAAWMEAIRAGNTPDFAQPWDCDARAPR